MFDYPTFNSRPHKEVDLWKAFEGDGNGLSIHDLTRRSTLPCNPFVRPRIFQFTTSQGGRLVFRVILLDTKPFNSRPHKEVDLVRMCEKLQEHSFNSRPHKEVDLSIGVGEEKDGLSIHDLTRRSTVMGRIVLTSEQTFQFTTSQGGRHD